MKPSALQQVEAKLLCQAILEANRWLADGEVSASYRCLMAGFERALEFAEAGESWAFSLADAYRRALHEISFVPPGPGRIPLVKPISD